MLIYLFVANSSNALLDSSKFFDEFKDLTLSFIHPKLENEQKFIQCNTQKTYVYISAYEFNEIDVDGALKFQATRSINHQKYHLSI